ncbi:S8 family serine peptidase [Chitinophaga pendula]|uniref:LamG-like jellyroll fold domain-containing protein n=1 Tax=Chitinophaga TaxID=79328 RepID=UPI0018E05286|nr:MULTISPECIES: LamG-like jellyroll fold domain-containing protein [Chitinophaga]UCJ05173.1 S8 family serine peptidase [Chitinophaga pendula]
MKKIYYLFLVLLCSYTAVAQQSPPGKRDYRILHMNRQFSPPDKLQSSSQGVFHNGRQDNNGRYTGDDYYLLQCYDIPGPAQRQQLLKLGITLLDYLPNYAYYTYFATDIDTSQLRANGIRTVITLEPAFKLSPEIIEQRIPAHARKGNQLELEVTVFDNADAPRSEGLLRQVADHIQPISRHSWRLTMTADKIQNLAAIKQVKYIAPVAGEPQSEDSDNSNMGRSNFINSGYGGVTYNGTGTNVMIRENGMYAGIDLQGRVLPGSHQPGTPGSHSSGVSSFLGFGGNADPRNRSNAWGANILAFSGGDLYALYDAADKQIRAVNMSYGWTLEDGKFSPAGYNGTTREHDNFVRTRPEAMLVYSSGNNGDNTPRGGKYSGLAGWGNLTGEPKHAKNIFTVSGTDYEDSYLAWTNSGPAYDGRIKPELSIEGLGGTSFAAPKVTGIFTIVRHAFQGETGQLHVPSGMIKAIMMNTADDVYNPGIDFKTGFGRPNVRRAYQLIKHRQFYTGTIGHAGQQTLQIPVPAGTAQLRVMLYWTDYESTVNAAQALVNDLDLVVKDAGNQAILPWGLDTTAIAARLNALPTRKEDHINNVEQVTVEQPAAGNYTVQIDGTLIPQGPQEFYVVYEFVKDEVVLSYPLGGESFVPGQQEYLRWDAWGNSGTFSVDYSRNGGNSWDTIANNIPAAKRAVKWTVPDYAGKILIRVRRGQQVAVSGEVAVLPQPQSFRVDWSCGRQLQLSWQRVGAAQEYEIFKLGEKYMQAVGRTMDSVFIVSQVDDNKEEWYAIRAIGANGIEGLRSNAIMKAAGTYKCYNVATGQATVADSLHVLLGGSLNPHQKNITDVVFEYGTGTNYGHRMAVNPGTLSGHIFTSVKALVPMDILSTDSIWHYRLQAKVDGVLTNGADAVIRLSPDSAWQTNGTQTLILGNNTAIAGARPRTIEMWAKVTQFNRGPLFRAGKKNNTKGDLAFRTFDITADTWMMAVDGNNTRSVLLPGSKDNWHHYAIVYTGTKILMYYDGVEKMNWDIALNTALDDITIGSWFEDYATNSIRRLNAQLEEVRVWNVARSVSEIRSTMYHSLRGDESGLVHYLNFDNNDPQAFDIVCQQWPEQTAGSTKTAAYLPVGYGYTAQGTEAGTLSLPSVQLQLSYQRHQSRGVSYSHIYTMPQLKTGLPDHFRQLTAGYWLGQQYGKDSTQLMQMKFNMKEMSAGDVPAASQVFLWARQGNTATSGWKLIRQAGRVDTTTNSVRFDSVKIYAQYLITRNNSAFLTTSVDSLPVADAKVGVSSQVVSYRIQSYQLNNALRITPPKGFEVSLRADSGFTGNDQPLIISAVDGAIADTTVYVRFVPFVAGDIHGYIQHTTDGQLLKSLPIQQKGNLVDQHAGTALKFDGDGDILTVSNLNWQPRTFTIEWWLKANTSKNYNQSIGNGWGSFLVHADNTRSLNVGVANNSNSRLLVSGAFNEPNTWHHYAYTFDEGVVKVYRDGILADSKNASTFPPVWSSFNIGSADGNTIDGELDEFRMWTSARSQQEIREYMHLTLKGNEPGLKMYLQFNKEDSNTVKVFDKSDNGYPIEVAGNPVYTISSVPVGKGISQTRTITGGEVLFEQAGITMSFDPAGTSPNGEVVVTKLMSVPHLSPKSGGTDSGYYIFRNYGTNSSFNGLKTLRISAQSTGSDTSLRSYLFDRSFNSFGDSWSLNTVAAEYDGNNYVYRFDDKRTLSYLGQIAITPVKTAAVGPDVTQAIRFDGQYGQLEITGLNWQPARFSIEWWLKASSSIDWNQSIGNGWGSFLAHANNNKSLSIGVANNERSRLTVANVFSDTSQWHHFAYTFDSGYARVFVDGELRDSLPNSSFPPAWKSFLLGSRDNGTLHGAMDEFRMWETARTPLEIREHMHHPLTGQEAGLRVYLPAAGNASYLIEQSPNHYLVRKNGVADNVPTTAPVAPGISYTTLLMNGWSAAGNSGLQVHYPSMNTIGQTVISHFTIAPNPPIGRSGNSFWLIRPYGHNHRPDSLQLGISVDGAFNYALYDRRLQPFNGVWTEMPQPGNVNDSSVVFAVAADTIGIFQVAVGSTLNKAPVVRITAPGHGQRFGIAPVTIKADAMDVDGRIKRVELYAGNRLLATLDTLPYVYNWGYVSTGTYRLSAKAYDYSGAISTSADVTIQVSNPAVCTDPEWKSDVDYQKGDRIRYQGFMYIARYANKGTAPVWVGKSAWERIGPCGFGNVPLPMPVKIAPNPTRDLIQVSMPAVQGRVVIKVMNLLGRVLQTHVQNGTNGTQLINISLGQYPAGHYLVVVEANGYLPAIEKVIKQ